MNKKKHAKNENKTRSPAGLNPLFAASTGWMQLYAYAIINSDSSGKRAAAPQHVTAAKQEEEQEEPKTAKSPVNVM